MTSPELYHEDVRKLPRGVVVRDLYGNIFERFGDRWFTPGSEVGYPHTVIQTPVYILWTPTRQAGE
jgi:hypothetical protein